MHKVVKTLLMGVLASAPGLAMAQQPSDSKLAPPPTTTAPPTNAVLVVPETDFDFGYAPQNSKIGHVYWLKNGGTDTLRLIDVKPGCGCTKAPLKKNSLAPGDSTDVEVMFSTGMYSNMTRKSASILATISGSAPTLNFSAFPVKSPDSLPVFTMTPPKLNLDSVASDNGEYTVTLRNVSKGPFDLKLVSVPNEYVHVDIPKGTVAPGAVAAIKVTVDPSAATVAVSKSFTIQASDSALTRYSFPIEKAGPTKTAQTSSSH